MKKGLRLLPETEGSSLNSMRAGCQRVTSQIKNEVGAKSSMLNLLTFVEMEKKKKKKVKLLSFIGTF